jgi:hypothetical protein
LLLVGQELAESVIVSLAGAVLELTSAWASICDARRRELGSQWRL